jgi:alkylation response protein AidB-like acyl-CoA dehydrogenase
MLADNGLKLPYLALSGLDGDLSDEHRGVQERLRDFALSVMRPTAARLDAMSAQEVVAPGSPLWSYLEQFETLSIGPSSLAALDGERLKTRLPIVFEELAYGDSGLAVVAFIGKAAEAAARASGDPELVERFGHLRGCWVATQADRGSDNADYAAFEVAAGAHQPEGSLRASVGASEIVLSGHSSDWISCGPIAECGLVFCPADYGAGIVRPDGGAYGAGMLVPFDLPGIRIGAPTEKIGQRSCPTGRIEFSDVRVPTKYLLHGRDGFNVAVDRILTGAAMNIASISLGIAKAAFEHAIRYAKERRQGGAPLTEHQLVRWRIFEMWQKLETARAMVRRAAAYNYSAKGPHILASLTAKVTASQSAFDVVSSAMRLFGANGLAEEFEVEKLMRDIQAPMAQAGENHFFGLQAANWLLRASDAQAPR